MLNPTLTSVIMTQLDTTNYGSVKEAPPVDTLEKPCTPLSTKTPKPEETQPKNASSSSTLTVETVSLLRQVSSKSSTFSDIQEDASPRSVLGRKSLTSSSSNVIEAVHPLRSSRHRRHPSSSSGMIKTQQSFVQDAKAFVPGTIPHSMVLALAIGIVCGVAAWMYYTVMWFLLHFLWKEVPQYLVSKYDIPVSYHVCWIPLIGFVMALGVGLTVRWMGEPGDLAYTIKCVHEKAYIAMDHVLPMAVSSLFSILGGGSLGPEAPLVAICAALGGFVSRRIFGQTDRNLIRKHTLMGMAGALAAFFGVPLGGSLFALEVNSRFGVEYYEHATEAILSGEVCLAVFRQLAGLPIEPIWLVAPDKLTSASSMDIVFGAAIGLLGAGTAWLFARFHSKCVMNVFRHYNLLADSQEAVRRVMAGASFVIILGMLIPQTLFWGEFEFQTIAAMQPASTLEHVWPTAGLLGFEMNSLPTAILVGGAKLIAISFTVAGGYRGGYIFPAFAAAAAFGRALAIVCPFIPVQVCVLCFAASVNVALTRTALATTLILVGLAGEPSAIPSVLAASLISLFVTGYMTFIQSQVARQDLNEDDLYDIICEEDEDLAYEETESDDVALLPTVNVRYQYGVQQEQHLPTDLNEQNSTGLPRYDDV